MVSRQADDSEGEGDDLLHSEDPSEDESDGGQSLKDFVVSDLRSTGIVISPLQSSATHRENSSPIRTPSIEKKQEPIRIDSSDDDMPGIDELVGTSQFTAPQRILEVESNQNGEDEENQDDEEDELRPLKPRREKRMVVADSEGDDE